MTATSRVGAGAGAVLRADDPREGQRSRPLVNGGHVWLPIDDTRRVLVDSMVNPRGATTFRRGGRGGSYLRMDRLVQPLLPELEMIFERRPDLLPNAASASAEILYRPVSTTATLVAVIER